MKNKNISSVFLTPKPIIIILLLLIKNYTYSQNTPIYNWSFEDDFSYLSPYDYDLGKYTHNPVAFHGHVIVNIDGSGGGTLIMYMDGDKYTAYIVSAFQTDKTYELKYKASNGRTGRAYFVYTRKYKPETNEWVNVISKFGFDSVTDNTASIWSYTY